MYFSEMIKLIQSKYDISFSCTVNYLTILDVVFLDSNPVSWNDHTLYIGNLAQVEVLPNRSIMLLTINNISLEDMLPEGSYWGIIDPKDTQRVYQVAKDLLYEDLKSEAALFKITQASLQGKNILSIINTAASLIGNALILGDSNMKVIAHSTVFDIMDPLWADNIEHGDYSNEFIKKVRSNKDMQEWSKSGKESRIITLKGDKQPKLVARISQKGHIIGALIMIAHHSPINPSHFKQLPQIGRILFDTLNSGSGDEIYKSFYSNILYHLLSGDELSDTFDLLTMSKAEFPKEMTIVVARFIRRVENRYLKQTVGVKLRKIFPKGYPVQYKNYIGILVPSVSSKQREKLSELVSTENLNIGLSWTFRNILDFKKYFTQAIASIKQAQNFGITNKVLDYTDYSFYDLLFHYTSKISLQNYCHPALQMLKEYDKSNKTELYITLKTFLNSNKNLKTTSESLFLHRNSVTYRINQIVKVTGIDLNAISTIYALVDSFRIEDFLEPGV
ncbi:helix-turn-helix domain-containing protein [Clostridium sp.]|uniref:PucR family transcriptional regulator n=1 Tax=Clostridium sp. TaxID=1506 RepID=UPI001A3A38C1|nr:helix-turn-helix domain-containing protein [Clostridium sp.]MBK5236452.1 helix-turn-helix domain-containing protein [Clostridium sp.]